MAIITIFSGTFCSGEQVAQGVAQRLGYTFIEQKLIEETSRRYRVPVEKLNRAIYGPPPFFAARFTRERERFLSYLKAELAKLIISDNVLYHGFAGHLIPKTISHVLRVCLIANHEHRIITAMTSEDLTEKEAAKKIRKADEERIQWTQHLYELSPWDESLYDIIIPMHSSSIQEAASSICEYTQEDAIRTTARSRKAAADFLLAAQVNVALVEKGHDLEISSEDGNVTLIINKTVSRLEQYQHEIEQITAGVAGVIGVSSRVGPKFNQTNIIRNMDFELPRKILLVDDEKEFVHTLSERLQNRNLESAIVYDGEEALSYIANEEPEVMVLDLKMPGIDGIEVLRRVKKEHPNVEVIILTGHGSEREEALANELGAFAYLHKPVNIDVLTKTMKEAYRKISESKSGK